MDLRKNIDLIWFLIFALAPAYSYSQPSYVLTNNQNITSTPVGESILRKWKGLDGVKKTNEGHISFAIQNIRCTLDNRISRIGRNICLAKYDKSACDALALDYSVEFYSSHQTIASPNTTSPQKVKADLQERTCILHLPKDAWQIPNPPAVAPVPSPAKTKTAPGVDAPQPFRF